MVEPKELGPKAEFKTPPPIDEARRKMLEEREAKFEEIGIRVSQETGLNEDQGRAKTIMDFLQQLYFEMVMKGLAEKNEGMIQAGLDIFTIREAMKTTLAQSPQNPAGQGTTNT